MIFFLIYRVISVTIVINIIAINKINYKIITTKVELCNYFIIQIQYNYHKYKKNFSLVLFVLLVLLVL